MARRQRRKYTPEQRADAVRLVRKVGNLAKVARELDLTPSALTSWVRQADIDEGQGGEGALTTDEREELRRLRRENRTLEMERDFLKRPRHSSPRNRIGLGADLGGEGEVPHRPHVSRARSFSQRLARIHSANPTQRA